MFTIMTKHNTARVTLNDNAGRAPSESVLVAKGAKSIWWAVATYAKRHGIPLNDVGYAVREEA